jgi:integrase
VWTSIEKDLLPDLGSRPIAPIDAPELLAMLRKIESRGAHETRMRAQQRAGADFRYAVVTGRAQRDPTADLRGAFTPARVTHYAALSEKELPGQLGCHASERNRLTDLALRKKREARCQSSVVLRKLVEEAVTEKARRESCPLVPENPMEGHPWATMAQAE